MKLLKWTKLSTPWFVRAAFPYCPELKEYIKAFPGTRGDGPPRWTWKVPIELCKRIEDKARACGLEVKWLS